jgi:hypothetical protein
MNLQNFLMWMAAYWAVILPALFIFIQLQGGRK